MTSILGVGQLAGRGTVLYTADTEPVVTLLAPDALFRDLSTASADGDDVKALEENLVALGYGAKLKVDRHYDVATAAAVKRWEQDLERKAPDGVVSVGEVVFLHEPAAVVSHRVSVGEKLDAGTSVLSLGTESRVVTISVEVDDREHWALDKVVELDWDRDPKTGTVTEVGREEVEGRVEITISLPQPPDVPTGTEVEARVTTAEKNGVVTVPVSAVVEGRNGSSVRLAGKENDDLTPVELGITADGLIEVTSGLQAGQEVRLPG
ncbi:MAG TPA: peptidoglycan-binding domain-containing protein [Actinomycetota bacterium]|nr:peptidoglycan-binding domain-containing protein [Actinomycetota bacterium]